MLEIEYLLKVLVFQNLEETLTKNVRDLDSFKLIMTTITVVLRMAVSAEIKFRSYQETYYTIGCHDLPVSTSPDLPSPSNFSSNRSTRKTLY